MDTIDAIVNVDSLLNIYKGQRIKLVNWPMNFRPNVLGSTNWRAIGEVQEMNLLFPKIIDPSELAAIMNIINYQPIATVVSCEIDNRFIYQSGSISVERFIQCARLIGLEYVRINSWGMKHEVGELNNEGHIVLNVDKVKTFDNICEAARNTIFKGETRCYVDVGCNASI